MRGFLLSMWIGFRYQKSQEKQRFLSLLSWVSLLGIMLGVAALIIVLSVMNGLQQELQSRLFTVMSHGKIVANSPQVLQANSLDDLQDRFITSNAIVDVEPWIGGEALLTTDHNLQVAVINGIDPSHFTFKQIQQYWVIGDASHFDSYQIIIGASLAKTLRVFVGDKITVTLPQVTSTPFGPTMRKRQFVVAGIFEVGADVDMTEVFIPITTAKKLFRHVDDLSSFALRLKVKDPFSVKTLQKKIDQIINKEQLNVTFKPWTSMRVKLFTAIKMEKVMVMLMLTLVILVAAFNLISMLTMMVAEKRSQIAVLSMMGLTRLQVLGIFLSQGMSLSLMSLSIGVLIGCAVAQWLNSLVTTVEKLLGFYIFDPSVFYISGMPSHLALSDVIYVIVVTLVVSLLFIIYPAYRATAIKPVEALTYQ